VPDVVVIDLGLPDEPGLVLVRRLLAKRPDLRIVIYTGLEDAALLGEALECGALGVMLKGSPITEVLDALRAARRGERYIDSRLAALLEDREDLPAILTKREREVFDLLAGGLTGEEIAVRLVLSPETVRTHVRNAMRKLEARTRTEAVVQAIERREIELHPRVATEA
jgi:DNA-binding NarL/FixJ family response regulator